MCWANVGSGQESLPQVSYYDLKTSEVSETSEVLSCHSTPRVVNPSGARALIASVTPAPCPVKLTEHQN
jgi:hypothetical protein